MAQFEVCGPPFVCVVENSTNLPCLGATQCDDKCTAETQLHSKTNCILDFINFHHHFEKILVEHFNILLITLQRFECCFEYGRLSYPLIYPQNPRLSTIIFARISLSEIHKDINYFLTIMINLLNPCEALLNHKSLA